jgi:hypothetical protein
MPPHYSEKTLSATENFNPVARYPTTLPEAHARIDELGRMYNALLAELDLVHTVAGMEAIHVDIDDKRHHALEMENLALKRKVRVLEKICHGLAAERKATV